MKPFDFEAALRGEPVVTRDGREVTQTTKFDVNNARHCIAAVVDGGIETFSIDGKFRIEDISQYDLFMATKTVKKEGWINVYAGDTGSPEYCYIYTTEEVAKKCVYKKCVATVKIEWEEEI